MVYVSGDFIAGKDGRKYGEKGKYILAGNAYVFTGLFTSELNTRHT